MMSHKKAFSEQALLMGAHLYNGILAVIIQQLGGVLMTRAPPHTTW